MPTYKYYRNIKINSKWSNTNFKCTISFHILISSNSRWCLFLKLKLKLKRRKVQQVLIKISRRWMTLRSKMSSLIPILQKRRENQLFQSRSVFHKCLLDNLLQDPSNRLIYFAKISIIFHWVKMEVKRVLKVQNNN